MNVVDSSGWLAYFSATPNGPRFQDVIADADALIVPSITVFEVYKWLVRERSEFDADVAVTVMSHGRSVDLDPLLAIAAARLSAEHRLAMADAIILATAQQFRATLWTQDADFQGIDGVHYIA